MDSYSQMLGLSLGHGRRQVRMQPETRFRCENHAFSVLNYTGQTACGLASFNPYAVTTTTEGTVSTTTTDEPLTNDNTTAASPAVRNYIYRGGYLRSGDSLFSSEQTFKLAMQSDGDLVVYKLKVNGDAEVSTWASNTFRMYEKPQSLHVLLNDNVVLLNARGEPVWNLGTLGMPFAGLSLFLLNNGSLCLAPITQNSTCVWHSPAPSGTGTGMWINLADSMHKSVLGNATNYPDKWSPLSPGKS
ncbi:hypothetical protein BV898_09724 [Hypsibius exemplaris]|uniref:Bulb-type lectin domain-containing protein n=1 Tax=Hypsibius exemplaris TaxID=2072580 RepID=A0A1W0WLK7_HYPEX|nr:hypothetical protein BV898_09724 [Hypsibius exemplaris]